MKEFFVIVRKRGEDETIAGTMRDDGLQSLWAVRTDTGEIRYVSVLDEFLTKEELAR